MKKYLILIFSTISFNAYAQSNQTDTVSFCQKLFPIPSECATPSKFQISCDDYAMFWFYLSKATLSSTVEKFVNGMINELDDCKTDSITVFLLGKKVPTIKLSCKANEVPNYQFFSYGIVNNQAVLSILTLWDDPKKNDDLPIVIKQILKLN